jgi:hypothetical protein
MSTHRLDLKRLAAVLGLLGSEHAGERAAAGVAATRMLAAAGATWMDVLYPTAEGKPEPDPLLKDWPVRWRGAIEVCSRSPGLTSWGANFLATIAGYEGRPSRQQLGRLRELFEELAGGEDVR